MGSRGKSPRGPSPKRRRRGLPPPESVVAEDELLSPSGSRYRVLTSTERDAYEQNNPGEEKKQSPDSDRKP